MSVCNTLPVQGVGFEGWTPRLATPEPREAITGGYPLERIVPALFSQSSDDRALWVKYLTALKHMDPVLGRIIGQQWSRRSDKYDADDFDRTWDSLNPRGEISYASILKFGKGESDGKAFAFLKSSGLRKVEVSIDFIVDNFLIEGQPSQIVGGSKTCKTSLMMDMAVSLANGTKFLGSHTTKQRRVMVMSGESGLASLKDLFLRIEKARGLTTPDEYFVLTDDIPHFSAPLEEWRAALVEYETQVVFVDPAYLAMDGTEAGNMFVMGQQLKPVADMCKELGITFVLLHHATKSSAAENRPLELTDVSWAGFGEFTRQSILVSRRESFRDDVGEHKLYVRSGGSAWGSRTFLVDINEGLFPDRVWEVSEKTVAELRSEKAESVLAHDAAKIIDALKAQPLLTEALKSAAGLSSTKWKAARAHLLESGAITESPQRNGKIYQLTNQEAKQDA